MVCSPPSDATQESAVSRAALLSPVPRIYEGFRRLPPPVILIGMHRSGTSLVAATLAELGVHMGAPLAPGTGIDERSRLGGYAEAQEFQSLNDQLLRHAGAAWSRAEPFLACRQEEQFSRAAVQRLQAATYGSLRRRYLASLAASGAQAWGWKDPRNSLILPYWLRLFPDARVLHVRRDPEAAADSLWKRALRWAETPPTPQPRSIPQRLQAALEEPDLALRSLLERAGLRPSATGPDPCLDRDYCRRLGALYTEECLRHRQLGPRYRDVWYEDLVAEPKTAAVELARFAGGHTGAEVLRRVAALVCPGVRPG